jgi:hypothetical protein
MICPIFYPFYQDCFAPSTGDDCGTGFDTILAMLL